MSVDEDTLSPPTAPVTPPDARDSYAGSHSQVDTLDASMRYAGRFDDTQPQDSEPLTLDSETYEPPLPFSPRSPVDSPHVPPFSPRLEVSPDTPLDAADPTQVHPFSPRLEVGPDTPLDAADQSQVHPFSPRLEVGPDTPPDAADPPQVHPFSPRLEVNPVTGCLMRRCPTSEGSYTMQEVGEDSQKPSF